MHIPDGFVSMSVNGAAALVSLAALTLGARRARRDFSDTAFAAPLLATMAAFVFAAQMLNFPIGGGTSGHFLGAALVAALLGPWSACLVMTVVLFIQALLFGDGGITALGSNLLNMGVIGGLMAYAVMRAARPYLPKGPAGYMAAAAIASWFSVVAASAACALELVLSGTSPLVVAMPAMVGTHAIIGLGEALIVSAVLAAVIKARPEIIPEWACLEKKAGAMRGPWRLIAPGFALAALLSLLGSPLASSYPDGLEKIAEEKGFLSLAEGAAILSQAPFQDYTMDFVGPEKISTSLAGLVGTALVFVFGFGFLRLLSSSWERRRRAGNG